MTATEKIIDRTADWIAARQDRICPQRGCTGTLRASGNPPATTLGGQNVYAAVRAWCRLCPYTTGAILHEPTDNPYQADTPIVVEPDPRSL